ncbi:MAG: hypothetical protein QM680_06940 [Luteolibacter sp.]
MDSQQEQIINERLSQWVAEQGFWFQLLHPVAGTSVVGRLMQLVSKLGLYLLILAVIAGFFFYRHLNSPVRGREVQAVLKDGLRAQELMATRISQSLVEFSMSRVAAVGGDGTFFNEFVARDVRCKRNLLSLLTGKWDAGLVEVDLLDLNLRAGADSPQSAAKIGDLIFRVTDEKQIQGLHASRSSVRWGFSERTRGCILDSELYAQRVGESWRLVFKGGTFSQNWLQDLQIEELVAVVSLDQIIFERARFKSNSGGSVELVDVVITCGSSPVVTGKVKFQHVSLDHLLPESGSQYLRGKISGDLSIAGSLNTAEGIRYEGKAFLLENDQIIPTEKIDLLEALTVADGVNKYRRPVFKEGSFQMKTSGGGLELSEIDLKAGDLLSLQGNISSLRSEADTQRSVEREMELAAAMPIFQDPKGQKEATAKKEEQGSAIARIVLGQVAHEANKQEEETSFKRHEYQGLIRLTFRADAFIRSERLKETLSKDHQTGRLVLNVPLDGGINDLTRKQAEQLLETARRGE